MEKTRAELIAKYDIPVPRYTSYPTLPHWNSEQFKLASWHEQVRLGYKANGKSGLSLYIHLPYCESLCTYCGCNTRITVNHEVEKPYIESLLKEWELYLQCINEPVLLREIHLGGGTPTFFSPENLTLLIGRLLETVKVHPKHSFSFEGHPGNTTFEHLQTLYDLGFRRVSYGIQDFDPKVQKAINRIQTFEQVREVTEWSRQIGYESVNFDLIYGLPFQTLDSIRQTIEYVADLKPDRIAFYSYAHVPWFKPGQRAYSEADLPKGEEKRKLNDQGREELLNLGYRDIGMDHFAMTDDALFKALESGELHRNFMGYTEHQSSFLIGLGVSAISDVGIGYAQNVKTVEAYRKAVEEDMIPVFKGHETTAAERSIREQVLQIICQRNLPSMHLLTLSSERRAKVAEMVVDGLVEVREDGLWVTDQGIQFLRNICAVFDPGFNLTPKKGVFSQSV